MKINEAGLNYWEEKELELGMRLMVAAEGFKDRMMSFNPAVFSVSAARSFINEFKKEHGFD